MKHETAPNCCYWCDWLMCQSNGKHYGKSRCRHCPLYKAEVKSKAHKTKEKHRKELDIYG